MFMFGLFPPVVCAVISITRREPLTCNETNVWQLLTLQPLGCCQNDFVKLHAVVLIGEKECLIRNGK